MAGWIVFVRVAVPLDWPEGGHEVRGGGRSATIEISVNGISIRAASLEIHK